MLRLVSWRDCLHELHSILFSGLNIGVKSLCVTAQASEGVYVAVAAFRDPLLVVLMIIHLFCFSLIFEKHSELVSIQDLDLACVVFKVRQISFMVDFPVVIAEEAEAFANTGALDCL